MPSFSLSRATGRAAALGLLVATVVGPTTSVAGPNRTMAEERRPAVVAAPAHAAAASAVDAALQRRVRRLMAKSSANHYGVVVDVAGRGRVVNLYPAAAMRPASTQKLFTTMPLLLHKPSTRLTTTIAVAAKPVHGVTPGDLIVHAAADPSVGRPDLHRLVHQVASTGLRTVTGDLVVDIGSRSLATRRAGWKADFVPDDIGPLSPFPVAEDTLRTDRAYLANPTMGNAAYLRAQLKLAGVKIRGTDRIVRSAPAGYVLARFTSLKLRGLVAHTLTVSDNFYAESLLALAGGHRGVDQVSAAAGVTDRSTATDGSGLSYDDRQTARGEVSLLDYAYSSSAWPDLKAALPVACRTGTLKHRFCKTIAAGRVFAKTGTLTHTTALAGFTTDGAGRHVTFAVICAGVHSTSKAEHATDQVVLALRRYMG